MPSTSQSEINLFRKCMKAHHLRYVENLERKRPIVPMLVGKILHEMLHNHVMAKKVSTFKKDAWDALDKYAEEYKKFFEEEREEYGDIIGNCERLFESYISTYRNDDLTYEDSEIFVATDLAEDLRFIGYIDKIAVDKHNRRWIMDHKFMKNIPDAEARFHELQMIYYIWAWNRWKPDQVVDGICWDYVRTTPPTEPTVLQNGGLSKKKNIRCDRATYEAAIKREGLDPEDYEDFMSTVLDKNESMFFERVFLPAPSKKQLAQVVEDLRTSAMMIRHLKGIAPKSMSKFNCQGCQFKQICEAEIRGLDVKFIKKKHFKKRERHSG